MTASKVGIPDRFAYSMTKGAVLTMTLSVTRNFVDKGIRCNCICPARMGTPEDVATLAAFLCSPSASFITGSAYDLDAGFTLLR